MISAKFVAGHSGCAEEWSPAFKEQSSGQFGHVLTRCWRALVCHGLHPGPAAPSLLQSLQGGAARAWLQIVCRVYIYICSVSISVQRFPSLSLRCVYKDTVFELFFLQNLAQIAKGWVWWVLLWAFCFLSFFFLVLFCLGGFALFFN